MDSPRRLNSSIFTTHQNHTVDRLLENHQLRQEIKKIQTANEVMISIKNQLIEKQKLFENRINEHEKEVQEKDAQIKILNEQMKKLVVDADEKQARIDKLELKLDTKKDYVKILEKFNEEQAVLKRYEAKLVEKDTAIKDKNVENARLNQRIQKLEKLLVEANNKEKQKLVTKQPKVELPPRIPPPGATAICNDGTYSFSQTRRGTCSWHGGVRQWL